MLICRRMEIAIDASRYKADGATGVEWYSWHIINALRKEFDEKSEDRLVLYSREVLSLEDAENRVLPARRFWTLKALSREIKKNPPDVLFVPSHTLPLNLPKRSVITIHDVAFRYLKSSYSFFQYQHLDRSTRRAVRRADKIIVPSAATAEDLAVFYNCPPEKIVHIDHGFSPPSSVDDDIFNKSEVFKYFDINPSTPYILFVGRLESKKNLERLVRAFSIFQKRHPDYKLVLAGKRGVGFSGILRTVRELNMGHSVIMPGYITEEEKHALYKYCKVFAFCSLYEGFGLPILEAFYHGKPVLTSNLSSMPEVGKDAVLYVDPHDAACIAEKIEILAQEDEYVKSLVEEGYARLKDFSWSKAAKETLKVLYGQ